MDISDSTIVAVLPTIAPRPFHTAHFIDRLKIQQPELWDSLIAEYGEGGRGAGSHYTAYSRVSQALSRASERGLLDKLPDYAKAPSDLKWGSPVIRYWTDAGGFHGNTFPDEVTPSDETFTEGAVTQVTVNRYERNPAARAACISHHGSTCQGCGIDFGKRYGERGANFIHVHHLEPLFKIKRGY